MMGHELARGRARSVRKGFKFEPSLCEELKRKGAQIPSESAKRTARYKDERHIVPREADLTSKTIEEVSRSKSTRPN